MAVIDKIRNHIKRQFEQELDLIIGDLRDEIRQQGHVATGNLLRSFKAEVNESISDGFLGVIFAADYWQPVDTGVAAGRIPYTPGRRSGRSSSKYIQGLLDWIETIRPGLSEKERKSFAFAIAATHKKEGMPTRGSYSFSRNGHRTNFVQRVLDKHINLLAAKIAGKTLAEQIGAELLRA